MKLMRDICVKEFDSYMPSSHVLYYYWEIGYEDLELVRIQFKEMMKEFLNKFEEQIINPDHKEFEEVDPGSPFYIDETDPKQCFDAFETALMKADFATRVTSGLLNKPLEENDESSLP